MPHSSQISRPSSSKKTSTSVGRRGRPHHERLALVEPEASPGSPPAGPPGSAAGSVMPCASSAALSFSQILGTEPQTVGRTSGRWAITARGSAIDVTVLPITIEPW